MDEGEGEEKEKEGEEGGESRVIFNVVNFSKTKSLYRDGMSPVVKSTSRPKWCLMSWGPSIVWCWRLRGSAGLG
ncbi:cytosolic carboxypeptidase 6-like protein [Lates japonicus]|uniref:Cytosolic carboxypeptidase 6-like protein n=1 Tax=Lates japonicus TaxID=270547 RepID=A0AAD3RIK8_LATJO|nr:cytosolic carboxypeptidase 6-like protein [Lates japonicus]